MHFTCPLHTAPLSFLFIVILAPNKPSNRIRCCFLYTSLYFVLFFCLILVKASRGRKRIRGRTGISGNPPTQYCLLITEQKIINRDLREIICGFFFWLNMSGRGMPIKLVPVKLVKAGFKPAPSSTMLERTPFLEWEFLILALRIVEL